MPEDLQLDLFDTTPDMELAELAGFPVRVPGWRKVNPRCKDDRGIIVINRISDDGMTYTPVTIALPPEWSVATDPYGVGFFRNPVGAGFPCLFCIQEGIAKVVGSVKIGPTANRWGGK